VPGIFAIGDVVRRYVSKHKAEEGALVAEYIAGQKPHINDNLIPGVADTWPEAAGVGATEQDLKTQGKAYKVGKFPFRALGRSRASGDIDGFVKILADKETDEILGVHDDRASYCRYDHRRCGSHGSIAHLAEDIARTESPTSYVYRSIQRSLSGCH
jgi:hypothetical protein